MVAANNIDNDNQATTAPRPSAAAALDLFNQYFFARSDAGELKRVALLVNWREGQKPKPCPSDKYLEKTLPSLVESHVCGTSAKAELHSSWLNKKTGKREDKREWRSQVFRVGAYYLDSGRTKWTCLDFDADGTDHSAPLADATAAALASMKICADLQLPAYLERSGRGKGWHVWIFFSAPVPVEQARELGHHLVPRDQFLVGGAPADPEAGRGIEVFPKQRSGKGARVGNMVWLPWWAGAAPGGNLFYLHNATDQLEPYLPTKFETLAPESFGATLKAAREKFPLPAQSTKKPPRGPAASSAVVDAAFTVGGTTASTSTPGTSLAPAALTQADWDAWRVKALEALPLESIYGQWLTGRSNGEWLECRDPASPSGDQNPSAGVATGSGESIRGNFHSHRSGETLNAFDFMIKHGLATNMGEASRKVAQLSGVPLPSIAPRMSDEEFAAWINNDGSSSATAAQAIPTSPKNYRPLSDLGNAERLIQRHGKDLRYVAALNSWFIWNGARWQRDTTAEIVRRASETARHIIEDLNLVAPVDHAMPGDDDRFDREVREIQKWALASESAARLKAMVELAGSLSVVVAQPGEFDRDPWLLNLLNGTLDLRSRDLREHRREDMLSRIVPVKLDPEAKCPRWQQFVAQIFQDDAELIQFIKRAAGYTLTGNDSEQVFFICWGTGENGKGRFTNVLLQLTGAADNDRTADEGYAVTVNIDSLSRRNKNMAGGDKPRPDLLAMRGARLVTASEQNEEVALDEALIKQFTGGDPVTVRGLYGENITFRPVCKVWLSVNHKPKAYESGHGFWRRVKPVPFTYQVPAHLKDPELDAKLSAELSGILNWALEGLEEWMEKGLGSAARIDEFKKEYRAEMDHLGRFIEEKCVTGADQKCTANEIYDAYQKWCEASGERPITKNNLGRKLTERGYIQDRSSLAWFRMGIGIREPVKKTDNDFDDRRTKDD